MKELFEFALSRISMIPLLFITSFFSSDSVSNNLQSDASENISVHFASNECERPEYYRVQHNSILEDQDGDQMDDDWEETYGLDPDDPDDWQYDPDNDGFSNLEEFRDDSIPSSANFSPDKVEVTTQGFDCFYVAEMGFINSDSLLDILIRDPSEEYTPAVRDFIMIQQSDNSFEIEDAQNYSFSELTDISMVLSVAELNLNNSKDIFLSGLSEFIPDVKDYMIIIAPLCELCFDRAMAYIPIPSHHLELGEEEMSFFSDLEQWLHDEDNFANSSTNTIAAPLLGLLSNYLGASLCFHDYVSLSWGTMDYESDESIIGSIQRSLNAIIEN